MANQPFDFHDLVNAGANIYNSTGTAVTTLLTGGFSNTGIISILATSNDTVDRVVVITINCASGALIYAVTVPAGAGYGVVPHVDCLTPLGFGPQTPLLLTATNDLTVELPVAVASGKQVNVYAQGGNW